MKFRDKARILADAAIRHWRDGHESSARLLVDSAIEEWRKSQNERKA